MNLSRSWLGAQNHLLQQQPSLPLTLRPTRLSSSRTAAATCSSNQEPARRSYCVAAGSLHSAASVTLRPTSSCRCKAPLRSASLPVSSVSRSCPGCDRWRLQRCRAASTDTADAASSGRPQGNDDDDEELDEQEQDLLNQMQTQSPYPDLEIPNVIDLNVEWGIPDLIQFNEGVGGAPRVWLSHPNSGQRLEVYLHGATITQWLKPDGTDALFFDEKNAFEGDSAIRGGVNVAFPQYRVGQLPEHGFASRLPWRVIGAGIENMDLLKQIEAFENAGREDQGEDEEGAAGSGISSTAAKASGEPEASNSSSNIGNSSAAPSSGGVGAAQATSAVQQSEAEVLGEAEAEMSEDEQAERAWDDEEDLEQRSRDAGSVPSAADGLTETDRELLEQARQQNEVDEAVDAATEDVLAALDKSIKDGNVAQLDVEGDIAPFIVLHLTDCEATRAAGWPHKFSLIYKITLMETDDFPSTTPGSELPDFGPTQTANPMDLEDDYIGGVLHEAEEGEVRDEGQVKEEGDDEIDGDNPPLQIKLQLMLRNCDPEGSEPMRFQMAAVARFLTLDILRRAEFIRVLGLGGQQVFDYSADSRVPVLGTVTDDFINYAGQRIDTTFINSSESTILFCPGERVHFEMINRSGFKDVVAYHPGLDTKSNPDDPHRFMAGLGAGHVATLKKLKPQEEWNAEYVIRYHNKYWVSPVFGEGMQPMPPLNVERWKGDQEAMESLEASDAPSEGEEPDLGAADDGPA